jgi:hypothetical protein
MAREVDSAVLRTSLRALTNDWAQCSHCRRAPLTGEVVHVLESGRYACTLCVDRAAKRDGAPVRSERVHASERRLTVAARAA